MENAIPYSLEAEVAVIGGLLNDPDKIYEIREILYPECFYDKKHRIIFESFLALINNSRAIDLLTTVDELKNNNKLIEAGDVDYLTKLSESVSIATNIYSYAQIVYEKHLIRETMRKAKEIINKAQSIDNADEIVEFAEKEIFSLSDLMRSTDFMNWEQLLNESRLKLEELMHNKNEYTGLNTGYGSLNNMTSGLQGGELIILAARPSMGKTAFSLNLMRNIAKSTKNNDPHIAFFSLEMPADQIVTRLLAITSGIPISKIRSGRLSNEDLMVLETTYERLAGYNIHIDDTPGIKINDLKSKARKLKNEKGLDAIFIDYLQLITTNQSHLGRTQEVSLISRELKALAKELDVPVIALSQLSRRVEERNSKKPQMSDIRESGAIEQDADIIMMLYRPEYYNNADNAEVAQYDGQTLLLIEKNRNGATGEIEFVFASESNNFKEVEKNINM